MSFDRIGPYDLTRGDFVAAAILVSLFTAGKSVRVTLAVYVLFALAMVALAFVTRTPLLAGIGVFLVLWIFVAVPALRSTKRSRDIYLEYSPQGIVTETPQIRTTYKWATIGRVKKVGSRLFIMITERIALVVPDRATSSDNMERLIATLSEERRAGV